MKIHLQLEGARLVGIHDEDGAPIEETIDEASEAITWAHDAGEQTTTVTIDLVAVQAALSWSRWHRLAAARGVPLAEPTERPAGVGPNTTRCPDVRCGQWVANPLMTGHLQVHEHRDARDAALDSDKVHAATLTARAYATMAGSRVPLGSELAVEDSDGRRHVIAVDLAQ